MRSVALYVSDARPHAAETARRVAALVREAGAALAVCGSNADVLGIDVSCDLHDAQLLVSIGGDGTLLRAARVAQPLKLPIIGVNTGRLGFLTEIETDEAGYTALRAAFGGAYEIEERVALIATVAGRDEPGHFALNDVVVRRGAQARMAPFGLVLDGETITHMPSDGVIVTTPTGSTGYFLSAGGPIVSPDVDAIGIGALMPHTLFARPLIVHSRSIIEITCDGEIARANLETDGAIAADLHAGDRVIVRRAEEPVRFARIRPHAFFARLEEKLQWGAPIKR